MIETIYKILLAGDKFKTGIHLKQLEIVSVDRLPKTKKKHKRLQKLVIQDIFRYI